VGFVAPYQGRGTDLERIFQVGKSGFVEKTNVVQREFICNPELYLYLDNLNLKEPLKRPRYPILLGRSSDLAFVENVNEVNLDECDEAYFQFTLLPFPFKGLATPIYALPVAFRGMVSRRPVKVSGFHIIETPPVLVKGSGILLDPEKRWGVFLHDSLCKVEQGALADSHRTLP
jgi:CRISPR-associated protein Cas5t